MKIISTAICAVLTVMAVSSHGSSIIKADVTSSLGPSFFIDDASTQGGDSNSQNFNLDRNWTLITPFSIGDGGTLLTIIGLGFALPGAGNTDANIFTATITYLGADETFGGGDDVLLGSATGTLNFSSGAGEYSWLFDTPITGTIDGVGDMFRVNITADSNIRLKNATSGTVPPSGNTGPKLSVAGSSVAVVPEPSALSLTAAGLASVLMLHRFAPQVNSALKNLQWPV